MKRAMLLGLAVLFVAGGILIAVSASRMKGGSRIRTEVVGTAADPEWAKEDWISEYHLTERSGRDFDSKELAGEVHVVSFFFASCPGPCERQNRQLEAIQSDFAKKGVKFLSITCDPKRDSPTALSAYAKKFQADPQQWLFLTGDLKLLRRIGAEVYGVALGEMTHVESFLVYDRAGQLRGKFPWNKPEKLAELRVMLDQLLAESLEDAQAKAGEAKAAEEAKRQAALEEARKHDEDEPAATTAGNENAEAKDADAAEAQATPEPKVNSEPQKQEP